MKNQYLYSYNCVRPKSKDELEFICDNMKEITANTFFKYVKMSELGYCCNTSYYKTIAKFKKDYHIRYYKCKSVSNNIDSYIMVHSAIEYIFKNKS
jgi:hypothetical protein